MGRRWFRYGLVGNLIFFGGGFASIAYLSIFFCNPVWIIFDVTDNSPKISEELAQ